MKYLLLVLWWTIGKLPFILRHTVAWHIQRFYWSNFFSGRKRWVCVFVNNNDFCVFADAYFRRWIRVCWYVRGFHNDISVWNKTKENCCYHWIAIGNRLRANHFVIIAKVIVVYILNTCHIWNLFIHIKTNSLLMLQVDFHRKYLLEVMIDISI